VGNSGVLSWTNIASHFGGFIVPSQTVTVTLAFTAEHPTQQLTVVNEAGVHDAINILGQSVFAGSDQSEGDAVGGSTPVTKTLDPPDFNPEVGLPITFTISILNDGAAELSYLPLEDTYDPAVLAFHYAVPSPTLVVTTTGVISWADLTADFGPIPPDTLITVTVVFTNLGTAETTVNQARVAGAQDEYGNDLGVGQDQVPIRILPSLAPTPTSDEEDEDEAVPTATPLPTATPFPTPTLTPMPAFPTTLPETGAAPDGWAWLAVGILLLSGGVVFKRFTSPS
jgi:hypothetical protein